MNGINIVGAIVVAVAVAGCDWRATAGIQEQKASVFQGLPAGWVQSEQPLLRYQVDTERGRLWVMTLDGVDLYDVETRRKMAHIQLPDWVWVGEPYNCAPDLALGPKGEALISSNVVPTLWRIDPVNLAVSRHELVLDQDTGKDVGFTGLAYSAEQGAFFAVSALHGSLWRIDPSLSRAQSITLSAPLPKACGLAMRSRAPEQRASRLVGLCVQADRGGWTVDLTPDQRSGHASPQPCAD